MRDSLLAMKAKFLVVALFACATLNGCKKNVTGDVAKFADQACACKDAACGNTVIDAFAKFVKENKDGTGDADEVKKSALRMTTCLATAGADMKKMSDAVNAP
jgi:hypothetical protein